LGATQSRQASASTALSPVGSQPLQQVGGEPPLDRQGDDAEGLAVTTKDTQKYLGKDGEAIQARQQGPDAPAKPDPAVEGLPLLAERHLGLGLVWQDDLQVGGSSPSPT